MSGFMKIYDLGGTNSDATINSNITELEGAVQAIRKDCDGYAVLPPAAGDRGDGYISFFCGSQATGAVQIGGSDELRWDRVKRQLKAGPGSASTPSITFTNDTDTGIFSYASNVLGVAVGGTGMLYITNGEMQFGRQVNASGYKLYDSAMALRLGTAATTSHSLVTGDVEVGGKLEVDGALYIDNSVTSNAMWLSLSHDQTDGYITTGSGGVKIGGQVFSALVTTTVIGSAHNVDWNNGNSQVLNLGSATGDVALTLTNAKAGASYALEIIQHATVPKAVSWPSTVKWVDGIVPVISVGASAVDLVTLFWTGTIYLANIGQSYS